MNLFGKDINNFTYEIIESAEPIKAWLDLESQLRNLRIKTYGENGSKFAEYSELSWPVIKNIENGKSYRFTSLWRYLYALNIEIIVDDFEQAAENITVFGELMKLKREHEKISMNDIFLLRKLKNERIIDIEKGRGYTRNTFLKYISSFEKISFSIKQITY